MNIREPQNDVSIRRAAPDDAAAFLGLFEAIVASTPYMGFEPGERSSTVQSQARVFENQPVSRDIHFIAFQAGTAVGFVSILRQARRKTLHMGSLVIGVHPEHRGHNVGRALCLTAEDEARKEGIQRLELTVVTANDPAVRLYRSLGYEQEGTRKGSLNCAGTFFDEFYMGKAL